MSKMMKIIATMKKRTGKRAARRPLEDDARLVGPVLGPGRPGRSRAASTPRTTRPRRRRPDASSSTMGRYWSITLSLRILVTASVCEARDSA